MFDVTRLRDVLLNKPETEWSLFFETGTEGLIGRTAAFTNWWLFHVLKDIYAGQDNSKPEEKCVPPEVEKAVVTDLCERVIALEKMVKGLRMQIGRLRKKGLPENVDVADASEKPDVE